MIHIQLEGIPERNYHDYEDHWSNDYCATTYFPEFYPKHINGSFSLLHSMGDCDRVKRIDEFAILTCKGANLEKFHIQTLEGIGKKCFLEIEGQLVIRNTVKSNMLGLFSVKKLKDVKVGMMVGEGFELDTTVLAKNILVKHLFQPEGDLLDCQEELISADLKEFAKF